MPDSKPAVALTIAGFDPSSGAGVTGDLQVFAAHGLFGTAAITALTVQSTRGVIGVEPISPELLRKTLAELEADLPAAGIKIGMLGSSAVVGVVADFLRSLGRPVPVVLDPVLRSSSGAGLLGAEGLVRLRDVLLPLVSWVTPNWMELAALSGCPVNTVAEAEEAAGSLGKRFPGLGIIATGGELDEPVDLLRPRSGQMVRLTGERVETTSTHGTGCAYSSALLCGLIVGIEPEEAASQAKRYVEGALRSAPGLGAGRGPMGLLWPLGANRWRTELQ